MTGDMFPEAQVIPADPDRRYTTRSTIEWCCAVAGWPGTSSLTHFPFDLDAAGDLESHWAFRWFCAPGSSPAEAAAAAGIDGLAHEWHGLVWCNPPYSHIEPWVRKAIAEVEARRCTVLMLLPGNRTEQPWWQEHVEPARDGRQVAFTLETHFVPGRVAFGHPGNPSAVGTGSPPFTCVLLVFRPPAV